MDLSEKKKLLTELNQKTVAVQRKFEDNLNLFTAVESSEIRANLNWAKNSIAEMAGELNEGLGNPILWGLGLLIFAGTVASGFYLFDKFYPVTLTVVNNIVNKVDARLEQFAQSPATLDTIQTVSHTMSLGFIAFMLGLGYLILRK